MLFGRLIHLKRGSVAPIVVLCVLSCCLLLAAAGGVNAAPNVQALRSVKVITFDESGDDLRFPSGISYDREGDELYVTSPQKNKLVVMTPDYFPYLSIGSGRGLNSISKTYVRNGLLYVCLGASMAEPRPHIAVFDMAFMPVRQIFFPEFTSFSPLGLVVGNNGNLYVVGMNGTGVMVLNSSGEFLRWIEPKDEVLELAEKAPILAIDIGADGRLYFLSEAMGRVYVYSPAERFLYKFGEKGGEPGKLSRPRGIAVDDVRRQVYLVDYQRHTMSIYSMAGEYLFEVGGMGGGRGWFYYPSDLVVDGQGRIIVADTFNHRLQVFEFIGSRGYGIDSRGERPVGVADSAEGADSIDSLGDRVAIVAEPEVADVIRIRSLKQALQTDRPGDFLVVTGLAKQKKDADEQQLQLSRKGYPAQVQSLEKGKSGTWHQVFVGPYVDPLEAYEIAEKIRAEEKLPAILKTRGEPLELMLPSSEPPAENQMVEPEGDAPAEAIVLPELEIPAIGGPEEPSDKIFPSVELLDWADRLPEDETHAPLEQMHKSLPDPAPLELPDEQPQGDRQGASLPVPHSSVAAPTDRFQVTPVGAAATLAVAPTEVAKAVDFCVTCHDNRIAKVCLQCHPRERQERIAGGR